MARRRRIQRASPSSSKWVFLVLAVYGGLLFCPSSDAFVGDYPTTALTGRRCCGTAAAAASLSSGGPPRGGGRLQSLLSAGSSRGALDARGTTGEGAADASELAASGRAIETAGADGLSLQLEELCRTNRWESAMDLLEGRHRGEHFSTDLTTTTSWYLMILSALEASSGSQHGVAADRGTGSTQTGAQAKDLLHRMLAMGETTKAWLPTAQVFDRVIRLSASTPSFLGGHNEDCTAHIETLWSLHRAIDDREADDKAKFLPSKEMYIAALRYCPMRDRNKAAKRAERLMMEMKALSVEYPHLTPDSVVANEVLAAWSMLGWKKCEAIVQDMIGVAQRDQGRQELMLDTSSFNILLNALAKSRDANSEVRAENWLRKMESMSTPPSLLESSASVKCEPDENSFNIVLNGWAMSRMPGSAQRATDILNHMKKRYEAGLTDVHPGTSTYGTVLKGWARSRASNAVHLAEGIFDEYVEACQEGKWNMTHNALTYNSMINCYAKSRRPDAGKRALELFETMKKNGGQPGWELCFVDTYTYTSVVDAIAKRESLEASELAISLLEEIETSYKETGDRRFQPTIQLYTSVVNAIGRSRKSPERAQAIVDRVESSYLKGSGRGACKPDVVFYNALINAYGWSDIEGRWQKCLHVLQRMIALYESKSIGDAKPDTVSFNSVLNACAYERADSQDKRDAIIKAVVETFEVLQQQPKGGYGHPDQSTYAQVLMAITNHVSKADDRRIALAESTFLQCAENGLVGVQIVMGLHSAVPYSHFCELVGPALHQPPTPQFSNKKPSFDLSKLPAEWTANAPRSNKTRNTQSRRSQGPSVTKDIVQKRGGKANNHT